MLTFIIYTSQFLYDVLELRDSLLSILFKHTFKQHLVIKSVNKHYH